MFQESNASVASVGMETREAAVTPRNSASPKGRKRSYAADEIKLAHGKHILYRGKYSLVLNFH